jgi:hypothetical protein
MRPDKIMQTRMTLIGMIVLLVAMVIASPSARALESTQVVTFQQRVEIAGTLLPPGTYIMERSNPGASLDVIRFFDTRGRHLYGTAVAVPTPREVPSDETRLAFAQNSATGTEQFARFYFAGEPFGERLIHAPEDLPWPTGGLGFEPSVCRHRDLSKDLEFRMCTQQLTGESFGESNKPSRSGE